MSTTDQTEDANNCIAESSEIQGWTIEERLIFATRAQASATLALVDEQRTANLIAMYLEGPHTISVDRGALGEQIKERLDLI